MKKCFFFTMTILIMFPSLSIAMTATTVKNSIACFNKESLEEMQQFAASQDKESFMAYINQKKCLVMNEGFDVTVIESPGMFGGITGFVFQGIKMWTTRNGLKNYR